VGYLLFVLGAALVWRGRDEVYVWIHDEACFVRRSFFALYRYRPLLRPAPGFASQSCPANFVGSLRRIPRNPITGGMILAFSDPCWSCSISSCNRDRRPGSMDNRHLALPLSSTMTPSLIVHGGAWDIPDESVDACKAGCQRALAAGWSVLNSGGSALDAVEAPS